MVKFLHTADWHIGRKLQGKDLLEDQQVVLDNLITEMKKINPDFLIIAGDLYDRSVPGKEATKLLQELLVKINIECNIPIFAISGNHDSRERLAIGEAWFSKHKFYLHTRLEKAFDRISYEDDLELHNQTYQRLRQPHFQQYLQIFLFQNQSLIHQKQKYALLKY